MSKNPFENLSCTEEQYKQLPKWKKIVGHAIDNVSGFTQHPVESTIAGLGYSGLTLVVLQLGIYLFDQRMRYLYTPETYESGKSLALWSIGFLCASSIMKIARNSSK